MKTLLTAATVLLLAGCELTQADQYRAAVPKADTVAIKIPQGKGAPLQSGVRRDGLLGETAETYQTTRGITVFVNGAGVVVLSLLKTITDYPPTSLDEKTAVWGPHTDALSPNTWRLTVTRTGAQDSYGYVLEAKAKTAADEAYVAILSGTHQSVGKNFGSGEFLLDFDAAQKLPEHDQNVGTVHYTYSHPAADAEVSVDAIFTAVRDEETKKTVDATYAYRSNAQGGSFEFSLDRDFAAGAGTERAVIKSRWQPNGAGRSDVKLQGGDLGTEATASECWDSNFGSTFFTNSYDANKAWGAESGCAFKTAEYSQLRL